MQKRELYLMSDYMYEFYQTKLRHVITRRCNEEISKIKSHVFHIDLKDEKVLYLKNKLQNLRKEMDYDKWRIADLFKYHRTSLTYSVHSGSIFNYNSHLGYNTTNVIIRLPKRYPPQLLSRKLGELYKTIDFTRKFQVDNDAVKTFNGEIVHQLLQHDHQDLNGKTNLTKVQFLEKVIAGNEDHYTPLVCHLVYNALIKEYNSMLDSYDISDIEERAVDMTTTRKILILDKLGVIDNLEGDFTTKGKQIAKLLGANRRTVRNLLRLIGMEKENELDNPKNAKGNEPFLKELESFLNKWTIKKNSK